MPTDNQVDKLIINELTKEQYEAIENPSSTELYVTEYTEATVMTGATSGAAGTSGLVPAPASGANTKYLRGDATWADVTLPANAYTIDNLLGGKNISISSEVSYGGCFSAWHLNWDASAPSTNVIPLQPDFPSAAIWPGSNMYMQTWTGNIYNQDSGIGAGDYTLEVKSGEDRGTTLIGATSTSPGFYQTTSVIYALKDISQSASGSNIIAQVSSQTYESHWLSISRKNGTCYLYIDGSYKGSATDLSNVTTFGYVVQNNLGAKEQWAFWNVALHADGLSYTPGNYTSDYLLGLAATIYKINCTVLDQNNKVPMANLPIVQLTQAAYDALVQAGTVDANTLYVIVSGS